MKLKLLQIIFLFFIFTNNLLANTKYFQQGLDLFKNKYNEAKFKFEQDIILIKKRNVVFIFIKNI